MDLLGRTTKITDPNSNVTYVVFDDLDHEVRTYAGWNSGTGTPTGPTQVVRHDLGNSYTETFTMTATPHLTSGVPDGTEAISGLQTLSRTYVSTGGQVSSTDDYFNLSGLTYSTSVMGLAGTNYYQTVYGYDVDGRQNRVAHPTGTIDRTVFDDLGRTISTWVGTNDTPTSGEWSPTNNTGSANMVQRTADVYDGGGAGDGNLTQETVYPGGSAANEVTQQYFDWRDRLVAVKAGVQGTESTSVYRPITYYDYNNLNEVIDTSKYDGDGVTITTTSGVPNKPSSSLLWAYTVTNYDEQGRVYETQVYSVTQGTGAVSTYSLNTNSYFDHAGNRIEQSNPGGVVTKYVYDGAGRVTITYTTDGAGGTGWSAASSVSSDHVLAQVEDTYDSNGNVILETTRQRFDDASATGSLNNGSTDPKARVSYVASYYDPANRITASVDVGTNGGSAYTRPSSVPTGSATVLVTSYAYNPAGWVQDVTDPRGIDQRTSYDALGRTTETIDDYTGSGPTASSDQTTDYTYDGDGHTLTITVKLPSSAIQETQYVYGVTTSGGSAINSNDLLATTEYPDPSTGSPSTSATQEELYTYNALGQVLTYQDRNGTVHSYTYDVLARLTSDTVTTLASGVDGSVRRIDTAYDEQSNPYLVTSYSDTAGTTVVNQVQRSYNGLGQETADYQAHSGTVNTSTTPVVQYGYNLMSGGANNSRPTSMTYPNGKVLTLNYDTGSQSTLDNAISRLSSLSDSGGTLEPLISYPIQLISETCYPCTTPQSTSLQVSL